MDDFRPEIMPTVLFAPESETPSSLKGIDAYKGFSEQDRQDILANNALKLFSRLQG